MSKLYIKKEPLLEKTRGFLKSPFAASLIFNEIEKSKSVEVEKIFDEELSLEMLDRYIEIINYYIEEPHSLDRDWLMLFKYMKNLLQTQIELNMFKKQSE